MPNSPSADNLEWTVLRVLQWATGYLKAREVESPRAAAEILLAHVLRVQRLELYLRHDQPLVPAELSKFKDAIRRRLRREPVAYIVGRKGFWTLDLRVTPEVLIPRPETELLVEFALDHLPRERPLQVLDLGTGSGAIALAVARERPAAHVVAVDSSEAALAVASANAQQHHLHNVRFVHGDWYQPLGAARFDLVLSNPPYIAEHDPHLQRGDLRFEPRAALAAGHDGYSAIRRIVDGALEHLQPGSWIAIEHGFDQAGSVCALLHAAGLRDEAALRDLAGHERVSVARAPG
jgi:release factor glutamine methyltransferase